MKKNFKMWKLIYNCIKIPYSSKNIINENIDTIFNKSKFIGNIFLEDLVKKVFNPKRLEKICIDYNISLYDLVDIY